MLMATLNRPGDLKNRYLELIRRFPLRPIRTDEELDEAVRVIDSLLSEDALAPEEQDYLDVLGGLVERYEAEAHPVAPLPDADMLQHLIEAKGVAQTEVASATGIAESTISEVLSGRRSLNRTHISKLARYFSVSPEVFAF
jgi:HTH-type transcriptional regulator/antitoxin HigA